MLITTGCGISQSSWNRWPTWPKYCGMVCDHLNIGAPAAGNQFIALSLLKQLEQSRATCAIVTWTSYEKLDLFVEGPTADEIRKYPSRNFILDWNGSVTDSDHGWWPSSVSEDNPIKQDYARWSSTKSHALTTLGSVLTVQEYCRRNSIPLYQWMSYEWPVDQWRDDADIGWMVNMIDWQNFGTKILADDYYAGPWKKYQQGDGYGLIPTAGWHAEFFRDDILPILQKHFSIRPIRMDKLVEAAELLSKRIYDEDSNIPA